MTTYLGRVSARNKAGTVAPITQAVAYQADGAPAEALARHAFDGDGLGGNYRCQIESSGTSIPSGVPTFVTFDSERFDVGAMHDNSTNNHRATIPAGRIANLVHCLAELNFVAGANDAGFTVNILDDQSNAVGQISVEVPAGVVVTRQVVGIKALPMPGSWLAVQIVQGSGDACTVGGLFSVFRGC